MKTRKRQRRLGTLLFLLPIIVIGSVVFYAYVSLNSPGSLAVQAIASNKYLPSGSSPLYLKVSATVEPATGGSSRSGTTSFTLSLHSGIYTVTYGPAEWYETPAARTVTVTSGVTAYSVAVYDVKPIVVRFGQSGFNSTQVTALHGVTPVIWLNNSGVTIQLVVSSTRTYSIGPGENATHIFPSPGAVTYQVQGSSSGGTVTVV